MPHRMLVASVSRMLVRWLEQVLASNINANSLFLESCMKILQAHKYFWPRDGASKYALALSDMLKQAGHAVVPFAMQNAKNLESPYSRFFVSEMALGDPLAVSFGNKIRYAGRMLYSVEAKKRIVALLDSERIDIAHIHNIYHHISPSILQEIKKRGIPIVMTLHDYNLISPNYTLFHHGRVHEEDARGWHLSCVKNKCVKDSRAASAFAVAEMAFHYKLMRYYERFVDRFIAPSAFMKNICIRYGIPARRIVHIPHPAPRAEPKDADGRGVVYAGRLSEEKGLNTLIMAARETSGIPYRIIGEGPLRAGLEKKIRELNIANVSFVGFQSGPQLDASIRSARLAVVPSVWYENAPLAILEPASMGMPVIGSRIGGIPEILPDDLLVPPYDHRALAAAIRFWHDASPDLRKDMGARLRERMRRVHDPKKHLDSVMGLYEMVRNM